MAHMEVIASEFARMAGVSPAAISTKIKHGTLIQNSGKKLDTDNPVNRAYLERKQSKMKEDLRLRSFAAGASGAPSVPAEIPASVPAQLLGGYASGTGAAGDMLKMTLGQLLRRYTSVDGIEKYAKILRDLSSADEREQKTQERRLVQIPKDFVVQRLFGYIDQLMHRLLDVPEAVCDQVVAVTLAGGDGVRISVQHIISDNITRCINGAKEHVVGELAALKGKYDSERAAELRVEDLVTAVREE